MNLKIDLACGPKLICNFPPLDMLIWFKLLLFRRGVQLASSREWRCKLILFALIRRSEYFDALRSGYLSKIKCDISSISDWTYLVSWSAMHSHIFPAETLNENSQSNEWRNESGISNFVAVSETKDSKLSVVGKKKRKKENERLIYCWCTDRGTWYSSG